MLPPEDDSEGRKRFEAYRNLYILGSIGVQLVVSIIIGVAVGVMLDRWLDTAPWMMLVFLFLGIAAGFMNIYKVAKKNMGVAPGDYPEGEAYSDEDDDY